MTETATCILDLAALASAVRPLGPGVHVVLDTFADSVRVAAWKDGELIASATIR